MTAIDVNTQFTDLATHQERWDEANALFMSFLDFAVGSHMWDKMYGVISPLKETTDLGEFNSNSCVREALWKGLRESIRMAEKKVGYNFSPQFHRTVLPRSPHSAERLKLTWPGIEAVDVTQTWVDHELTAPVDPFLVDPVTVVSAPPETFARIPRALVGNPNDLILRRQADGGTYKTLKVRQVGANWEIVLDVNTVPYNAMTDVMVAQHAKYCYLDIELPDDLTGELFPVYPGTNQIIPQAKPFEELDATHRRYWFYPFTLVDPVFYSEPVDLTAGEFYKLLEVVEFRERQQIEIKTRLEKRCTQDCGDCKCTDRNYQFTTKIVDAARGIVSFTLDGELVDDGMGGEVLSDKPCSHVEVDIHSTYTLTIYYKTNPENLSESHAQDLSGLRRAILHKVAAELPVADCSCSLQQGFIYDCQQSYGSVTRTFGGDTRLQTNYGNRHGQHVYREIMANVHFYRSTTV